MSQNSQRFQISEIKTPVLPMNLNMELQSSRNQIQMPIYEKMDENFIKKFIEICNSKVLRIYVPFLLHAEQCIRDNALKMERLMKNFGT